MLTATLDIGVERLKRLPMNANDVWQLAVVRMPNWVDGEAGRRPYRPVLALCRSAEAGLVGHSDLRHPDEQAGDLWPLAALVSLGREPGVQYRPARLEVRDSRLVSALAPALQELDMDVLLVDRLELVDEVVADMLVRMGGPASSTSYLDGMGVDLARLRDFAGAAAEFYRAAPWNQLSDLDLVRVESPVPDPGMRLFVIMGASGIMKGIGFHLSRSEHERTIDGDGFESADFSKRRRWLLTLGTVTDLPIPDADLWEEHDLPTAADDAYPLLIGLGPGAIRRADAAVLAFAEGLFRATASSTEDELDTGRWIKRVPSSAGELAIELSIPALLGGPGARSRREHKLPDRRLMERTLRDVSRLTQEQSFGSTEELNEFLASKSGMVPHASARTPAEQAQERFYSALEASGRLRVKLAREAIRLWPQCADAHVLLAEEMPDRTRRAGLYRKGLEAAQEELGPTPFEEDVGHFWSVLVTRPYMRARLGLARTLWELGQLDEAIGHWKDLLRLNPGDNQGVRFDLLPHLLEMDRDEEAIEVLAGFLEDISPLCAYARALLAFRRAGEGAECDQRLREATRTNPHVTKYLLDAALAPARLPDRYRIGSEEEAMITAAMLLPAWQATRGAGEWLRGFRRRARKAREQRRKARR